MLFDQEGLPVLSAEDTESTILVVDGDVIAHIHVADYVQLFAHAEAMRDLLVEFSVRRCDKVNGAHSPRCRACAASILLKHIEQASQPPALH
jgi:hypothetical protein